MDVVMYVCVPYTVQLPVGLWYRVLSWSYRICPSPLKCQTRFGSNQVLYELLLSSAPFTFVPYATLCSIRNSMFMFFIYILNNPTIYFGHKLTFFLKFNKFQSLKLFFRDFSSSANLV